MAKSAVVPKLVQSDSDFVEANSKLTLLSAIGSVAGAALGGLALLGGSSWPAAAAVVSFTLTLVLAVQVPRITVAPAPTTADERAELRGAGIVTAAWAMGMLRASVGFMTFLLAFEFRGGDEGVATEGVGRGVGAAVGVARHQDIFGSPGAPAWYHQGHPADPDVNLWCFAEVIFGDDVAVEDIDVPIGGRAGILADKMNVIERKFV